MSEEKGLWRLRGKFTIEEAENIAELSDKNVAHFQKDVLMHIYKTFRCPDGTKGALRLRLKRAKLIVPLRRGRGNYGCWQITERCAEFLGLEYKPFKRQPKKLKITIGK